MRRPAAVAGRLGTSIPAYGSRGALAASWPRIWSATVLLFLFSLSAVPLAAEELPAVPAGLGTMETVAGPGFCDGRSRVDPRSSSVGDLAVDSDGVVHARVGVSSAGLIARIAGDGQTALISVGPLGPLGAGDGRPRPGQLAPDGAGGVLVAEGTAVLRLTSGGRQVVAGSSADQPMAPASGDEESGDGGPSDAARFLAIEAIATDESGSLFVAEAVTEGQEDLSVRFVNRGHAPATFYAGSDHEVTVAPGAIDIIARVEAAPGAGETPKPSPRVSLAVTGSRLYVGLFPPAAGAGAAGRVAMVNLGADIVKAHGLDVPPAGEVTVVGGPDERSVALTAPTAISTDRTGNLFVVEADADRVLRVDAEGEASVFAGATEATSSANRGFNGNSRPAAGAKLNRPADVAVGREGDVYISDAGNGQLRVVDRGGLIHLAAGNGAGLTWSCPEAADGLTTSPRQVGPIVLAGDDRGNIYIAAESTQIFRLDPSGSLDTVVDLPSGTRAGRRPGAAAQEEPTMRASLSLARGLEADPDGIYILGGRSVRFANLGSRPIRRHGRVVASGEMAEVATGLSNEAAGLALDDRGNLFVGDVDGVRRIDRSGWMTTVLKLGTLGASDGSSPRCCHSVGGLVMAPDGRLYVSDARASLVLVANPSSEPLAVGGETLAPGASRVVAGTGDKGFDGDGGPAVEARLGVPEGLALDRLGNLFIADIVALGGVVIRDQSIRMVDPQGIITTVAGAGVSGFNGDGLDARRTALRRPTDVLIDQCGNLLIADQDNLRVRRVRLVAECMALAAPDRESRWLKTWLASLTFATALTAVALHRIGGH